MKQGLGIAVLVVGLGGLGLWGANSHAPRIENQIERAAGSVVSVTTHGMQAAVDGRDITVTGIANDTAERDRILAGLNQVPGRRVITDDLTILPQRDPFEMSAELTAEGAFTLRGSVPTESARATLAEVVGTDAVAPLELAAGAPDAGWYKAARQGLEALAGTNFGALDMQGQALVLQGEAQNPDAATAVEAALIDLPQGYTTDVSLTLLDDGLPFALVLEAAEGTATWQSGKLPTSLGLDALDDAFGNLIEGEMVFAKIGAEDTDWAQAATQATQALSQLKTGRLEIQDRAVTLTGLAPLPTDAAVVEAAMDALPEGFAVAVTLDIEDDGAPFALELSKTEDGVSGLGKLPANLPIEELDVTLGGPVSGAIDQARIGVDDSLFTPAARAGLAALAVVESGSLKVTETGAVSLTGLVEDPTAMAQAEGALAGLGSVETVISYVDDGLPFVLDLIKGPRGVSGLGKLPAASPLADVENALGMPIKGSVQQSYLGLGESEFGLAVKAGVTALSALKKGRLIVADDGVSLVGLAATPDALAQARDALTHVPDGLALNAEFELEDDGLPFAFLASTDEDGLTLSGKLPASLRNTDLGAAGAAALADGTLTVARIGGDDSAFALVVPAGLRALAAMREGELNVQPDGATLTGTVLDPDAQAQVESFLAEVPYAMDLATDFTLLDDGAPVAVTLAYDAESGAQISGKLPAGLSADDLGAALGLPLTGETTQAYENSAGAQALTDAAAALAPWLADMETVSLSWAEDGAAVLAQALAGADAELLGVGLALALGGDWETTVTPASASAPDGATRTNAATGLAEVASAGVWLPVVDITPTPQACTDETAAALGTNPITFVTGSDRLDERAHRALGPVAAFALACAGAGLVLEVGGHTDSSGDTEANTALSEARASAVIAALAQRGVPTQTITAVGYGDSQPTATNDTTEGRAQNRRITFGWAAPAVTPDPAPEDSADQDGD